MKKNGRWLLFLYSLAVGLSSVAQEPSTPVPAAAVTELTVDARVLLSAVMALADAHIKSMVGALEAAATTEEVKSADWDWMKELLAKVQERGIPALVWFVLPGGSYYTVEKGLTDQNLKDRAYFPRVMAGEVSVGELVISKSTGRKSVVVAVPVTKDGSVIGALGASIYLDQLSDVLKRELALPKNTIFYALDGRGQTALNWSTDLIFQDPTAQGSESLTKAVGEILANPEGATEYEFNGKRRKVVYRTSPLTGWHFAFGVVTGEAPPPRDQE
ncbi:MAG: cache domain-containing protein [Verrucomicrobiota bacterium]